MIICAICGQRIACIDPVFSFRCELPALDIPERRLVRGNDEMNCVGSSSDNDSSDRAEDWSDFRTMALMCAISKQISGKCFNLSSTVSETGVGYS